MIIAIVYLIFTKKDIYDRISWFLVILFLPIFGVFLFYIIGITQTNPRTYRKKLKEDVKVYTQLKNTMMVNMKYDLNSEISQLKQFIPQGVLTQGNQIIPLTGMAIYDAIYEDLLKAEEYIHIEIYISRMDDVTNRIFSLLKEKARAGVKVRFLADVVGHFLLKDKIIASLIASGIDFHFFNERAKRYLDHFHVNHRKIIIIDGKVAYTGGVNFGREYVYGYPNKNLLWYDLMMRIEGDVINNLQFTFLSDWQFSTNEKILTQSIEKRQYFKEIENQFFDKKAPFTYAFADGPDFQQNAFEHIILFEIQRAKKRIFLTTPYFIPSDAIINELVFAAKRGVDVKLIIPGVPDKSYVYACTQSYLARILYAGVKVYTMRETFVHSKLILIDSHISMFGTINLDMRSIYLNLEYWMVQYNDFELSNKFMEHFQYMLTKSVKINPEDWKKRSIWQRMKEFFWRIFAPLL